MKFGFYPKLAWDGIRKNKRLYTPYILTCSGMVMMFYIIHYLAAMPMLNEMAGGRSSAMMLGFGTSSAGGKRSSACITFWVWARET